MVKDAVPGSFHSPSLPFDKLRGSFVLGQDDRAKRYRPQRHFEEVGKFAGLHSAR
jgi:hypothetical protein